MIVSDLKNCKRYKNIIPYFKDLFTFLNDNDLKTKEKGRISIIENELYINVVEINAKEQSEQILEAHQDYIDIHIPLNKEEIIGWKLTKNCSQIIDPYSKENDCVLFSDTPSTFFKIFPGEFIVVFPEDAHAPAIGEGMLKKAIVKIRIKNNY